MNAFLGILACMAAAGLGLHALLLRRLRTNHVRLWEELGSPQLVLNNSIRNGRAVLARLRSRAFEALGDPVLARLSVVLRHLGRVYAAAFAVLLIVLTIQHLG